MTGPILTPSDTHLKMRIVSIRQDNPRTRTLFLDKPLESQPGQFIMLWLPGVGEKPFSIAGRDPLTLTVVDVGDFSHAINSLLPEQSVWVRGPLGRGYQPNGKHLLLVAGGYGAAPLSFLAKTALEAGKSVEVCLGARQAADIILLDEFRAMGAGVVISTDDGSLGQKGLVTHIAETCIRDNRPDGLYACGPLKMLQAAETLGSRYAIPCQLSWEAFMRCGIGLCGHCELFLTEPTPLGLENAPHHHPGWLVCLDGPVSHPQT